MIRPASYAVVLLVVCQTAYGRFDIGNVLDQLHHVDIDDVVNAVSEDAKDVGKALDRASNDVEDINVIKVMKQASDDVKDIDVNKILKEASSDIKDIDTGKVLEKASDDIKDVDKVLRKASSGIEDILDDVLPESTGTGCKCDRNNCGCCLDMDIPKIKLNDTVCINITYLPKDYGISLTFSINGVIYLKETISARNPPPICFKIPYLKNLVSACIDFYDLDISKQKFYGCVKLELEIEHLRIIHQHLGCFKIPLQEGEARQLKLLKKPEA